MTAQEKDRIQNAIRHMQTAVDIDSWAVEIAVDAMQEKIEHFADVSKKDDIRDGTKKKGDAIWRQDAIDAINELHDKPNAWLDVAVDALERLPSAQPEPLSDAYMNAVLTWLIDYQIKAAELKGRYTPYEVLSWVVNDWRKEHE